MEIRLVSLESLRAYRQTDMENISSFDFRVRKKPPNHKNRARDFALVSYKLDALLPSTSGRAVAQAVSPWLPTATARFRLRAACGVCGGQSGTGAGFLRVLRFPLPIISPISPSS
jgi:hypothetical protein